MNLTDVLQYNFGPVPPDVHFVIGRYKVKQDSTDVRSGTDFSSTVPYHAYNLPVLLERLTEKTWHIVNSEATYNRSPDIWIAFPLGVGHVVNVAGRRIDLSSAQHQLDQLDRELITWQKLHRQLKNERDLLNDLVTILKERVYELENGKGTPQVTNWEPLPSGFFNIPSSPVINSNKEKDND